MSVRTYSQILERAKTCQAYVKKHYKIGISYKWSYYFAKQILNNDKKDITKIKHDDCNSQTCSNISRQITKAEYLDVCKRYTEYIEKNHKFPVYVSYGNYKISPNLLTELLSRIIVWSNEHNKLPSYANINSKVFVKPSENHNDVYNYFVQKFGSFNNTIDGALGKIAGNGYGYYYDDVYSNKTSIDRMKSGNGVNCTDSCQVFYNIMLELIKMGKYKKVECLHIKCSGGDGHVRLRITMNDGSYIYRDPASVLSNGNVTGNWCMNGTLLAVNPSWFMENLNR